MTQSKTILISGVSSGLGQAFAKACLDAGHHVLGTVRTTEAADIFRQQHSVSKATPLLLDVAALDLIPSVIGAAEREFGPIDILVNNAGYGFEGVLEESTMAQLKAQFDVNVFGAVAMMQAVLPGMRARRRGHIVNVTSMGGFITMPGISFYCGSKFALEGISESLAKEVRHLGIFVTALAPGQFRTEWAGRSMVRASRHLSEYDEVMDPIRAARISKSGKQPGDPAKAAAALLELIAAKEPPQHLILGADALKIVEQKMAALKQEMSEWSALTISTSFDSPD